MTSPIELSPQDTGLTAVGPFDGRYAEIGREIAPWFSEFGLMRARLTVETQYLKALSRIGIIRPAYEDETNILDELSGNLDTAAGSRIKEIESKTHHDIQALVIYLKERLGQSSLSYITEYVHFGLTSDDVNNLAWRLGLKEVKSEVILPTGSILVRQLAYTAEKYKGLPLLARTHGQPAVPTTFGKEMVNFAVRLSRQYKRLRDVNFRGKLNGAVGNFNSLALTYPQIDWIQFSQDFIKSLGLEADVFTTQVNPNDDIAEYLQRIANINTILHSLDRDMWIYISNDLLVEKRRRCRFLHYASENKPDRF